MLPPQAPGRGLPTSSSPGDSKRPGAGGHIPPVSASVSTWLLLWVCVSSSVSSQDIVIGRRAPLTQDNLLSDPALIPPAKTLYPHNVILREQRVQIVTFAGGRDTMKPIRGHWQSSWDTWPGHRASACPLASLVPRPAGRGFSQTSCTHCFLRVTRTELLVTRGQQLPLMSRPAGLSR